MILQIARKHLKLWIYSLMKYAVYVCPNSKEGDTCKFNELPTYLPIQKGSLIFIKIYTSIVPPMFFFIFGVKRENFLIGLKIDFKFVIFDLKKGEIFFKKWKKYEILSQLTAFEKVGNLFTKWKKNKLWIL